MPIVRQSCALLALLIAITYVCVGDRNRPRWVPQLSPSLWHMKLERQPTPVVNLDKESQPESVLQESQAKSTVQDKSDDVGCQGRGSQCVVAPMTLQSGVDALLQLHDESKPAMIVDEPPVTNSQKHWNRISNAVKGSDGKQGNGTAVKKENAIAKPKEDSMTGNVEGNGTEAVEGDGKEAATKDDAAAKPNEDSLTGVVEGKGVEAVEGNGDQRSSMTKSQKNLKKIIDAVNAMKKGQGNSSENGNSSQNGNETAVKEENETARTTQHLTKEEEVTSQASIADSISAEDAGVEKSPTCQQCHFWQVCKVMPALPDRPFCTTGLYADIIIFSIYAIFFLLVWAFTRNVNVMDDLVPIGEEELSQEESQLVETQQTLLTQLEGVRVAMASLTMQIEGVSKMVATDESDLTLPTNTGNFDELVPEGVQDCTAEEKLNARASAVFQAALPYMRFGVQTGKILQERKDNMVSKSTELVSEEVGAAFEDSAGIPLGDLSAKRLSQEVDWFALGLFCAGILAPGQIHLTHASTILNGMCRLLYMAIAVIALAAQWSLPCTHSFAYGNPLCMRNWLVTDVAIQLVLLIAAVPVIQLSGSAIKEVSRHAVHPENLARLEPMEYMKEILLYDANYGAVAVLRLDQINGCRGIKIARCIMYLNFVWLVYGFLLVIDKPYHTCASNWILQVSRLRIIFFTMIVGVELTNIAFCIIQTLLESDEVFYRVLQITKEFDRDFSPFGIPMAEMVARAFAVRDCTADPLEGQESFKRRELGIVQEEVSVVRKEADMITSELHRIERKIVERDEQLSSSLQREKVLSDSFLQQIHAEGSRLEEEALHMAEDIATRLDDPEMGGRYGDISDLRTAAQESMSAAQESMSAAATTSLAQAQDAVEEAVRQEHHATEGGTGEPQ